MSGFIPERILDEIRFRNDIVEVIGAYLPLKRTGSTYKACCPFHKEKTPSFNVNPNMQIFKCFGCGEGGDVISFLMKHQGLDFVTAARMLADRAGIEIEVQADQGEGAQRKTLYEIHSGVARFYRRCLEKFSAAAHARSYVKGRGLDGEVGEAFQIGYAPAGWDNTLKWGAKYGYSADQLELAGLVLRSSKPGRQDSVYDRFRDRLMFPICDSQGRAIGFSARLLANDPKQPKYVNSPETPLFTKGRVLYGLDKARRHIVNAKEREAIICEGQIDVIRCHQFGLSTAVAAQGTAFTDEHVQLLKNYADSVVLVYDADSAGQTAAVKTAHLFMKAGLIVRIAVLPAGEDPDSFLQVKGVEPLRALLEKAGSVVAFQVAVLGAQETDVRGIAATARLSKAVLQTVSLCPNAVQRERLLQEAASLLGLTQHALEADLVEMEKTVKRGMAREAARAAGSRRGRGPSGFPVPADAAGSPPASSPPVRAETEFEDEPPAEVLERWRAQNRAGLTASASPAAQARMSDEERMLCEHLLQGAGEDSALVGLVEEFLPPVMLKHPLCRLLVDAVLEADAAGTPLDEVLAEKNGAGVGLCEFAATLRALPMRVKGSDYTRRDAIKDLLLRFWRRRLQRERKRLMLPRASGSRPEDAARRIQITMDINHLKQWDTGQDVIMIERALMESAGDAESARPEAGSEA